MCHTMHNLANKLNKCQKLQCKRTAIPKRETFELYWSPGNFCNAYRSCCSLTSAKIIPQITQPGDVNSNSDLDFSEFKKSIRKIILGLLSTLAIFQFPKRCLVKNEKSILVAASRLFNYAIDAKSVNAIVLANRKCKCWQYNEFELNHAQTDA